MIWRKFARHFYLFRGTPTGYWLKDQLKNVFGVGQALNAKTADDVYEAVDRKLNSPAFRPRALFERFNIEVLCTTDPATDDLRHHKAIRQSGWKGRILPTFRPDGVLDVLRPDWKANLDRLGDLSRTSVDHYSGYVRALERRREDFRKMGATATDHGAPSPLTASLSSAKAGQLFLKALKRKISESEADLFRAHMLTEMARMSVEDGLVMQFHPGSFRNHNPVLFGRYGPDKGADIPAQAEYTRNLKPLLDRFGNNTRLTLVLFTLDESTYSRELAPLAGHYPAVRLGPPWWFNDSLQGMTRFRDQVMETAGLYNTAGFNDDARNFCSIPSRHDLARRVDANWLASQVARGLLDLDEATEMAREMAYGLAKSTYKL